MKMLKNHIEYQIRVTVLVAGFLALFSVVSTHASAQSAFEDPTTGGGTPRPNLIASTQQIDGGEISIGSSAQIVALFTNDGNEPVLVQDVNLYPSSSITARVGINQCKDSPLTPGAECAITINVTGLQSGTWRVELLVNHSGQSRLATATISGDVSAGGDGDNGPTDLFPRPSSVDFGSISGRSPLLRSILLSNTTSSAITVEQVEISASGRSGFTLNENCDILEPGQSCIAQVTWTPVLSGQVSGVLIVHHSGPSKIIQVELDGTYAPSEIAEATPWPEAAPGEGLLVADRTEIDFGSEVDGAAAITTSLLNVGDEDVVIDLLRLAGSDNGLSIARDGCRLGIVLQPTEACTLTINWLPRRIGPIIDDVQILHSGARGVLVLPIRGEAENPVSATAKQTITKERDGELVEVAVTAPNLDGYTITSHSQSKAILSGPTGSRVVRDGELVVLEGAEWVAKIVPSGVEMVGDFDRFLLVFDSSLGPQDIRTPALGSNPAGEDSDDE